MVDARTDAEARFPQDIAQHQLVVLRDDGLYRHLIFSRPTTGIQRFDIVTWPGYLAYVGDMGDFVFARIPDMLEFFRGDGINPGYWEEKIQAGEAQRYSPEKARAWIKEALDEADAPPDVRGEADWISVDDGADETYRQLRDFEPSEVFEGWQEARFNDYTFHYIWCCLALVWGIRQYDAWAKAKG
jgi:hypothetical protein